MLLLILVCLLYSNKPLELTVFYKSNSDLFFLIIRLSEWSKVLWRISNHTKETAHLPKFICDSELSDVANAFSQTQCLKGSLLGSSQSALPLGLKPLTNWQKSDRSSPVHFSLGGSIQVHHCYERNCQSISSSVWMWLHLETGSLQIQSLLDEAVMVWRKS